MDLIRKGRASRVRTAVSALLVAFVASVMLGLPSLVAPASSPVAGIGVSQASASSSAGRQCHPVGSFTRWHAAYYYDGSYVGSGPRRTFKYQASDDCIRYIL